MSKAAKLPSKEEAAKTRLRLWLKLLKMSRQIEGELRENIRTEFESTLPRFDVMAAMYRFPKGLRMNELSAVLKVSNGNVTGIIDRLVNDALVVRVAVPGDRRALLVKLTPKGKNVFLKQATAHKEWVNDLLGNVSVDEAEMMMSLANKVISTPSDQSAKA